MCQVKISIDHVGVSQNLQSKFLNFENAIQPFSGLSFGRGKTVLRNVQYYTFAEISVVLPIEAIKKNRNTRWQAKAKL